MGAYQMDAAAVAAVLATLDAVLRRRSLSLDARHEL